MFNKRFVTELFKAQDIYSNHEIRQIFKKLAHSSIMRLSPTSMNKLYDLMTMSVKYQFLSCENPCQIYQVTLNHFIALEKMSKHSQAYTNVKFCLDLFIKTYSNFSIYQWLTIKRMLLSCLQDRRIKVSLFLLRKLQSNDGNIILSHEGYLGYYSSKIPGLITYYNSLKSVEKYTTSNSKNVLLYKANHIVTLGNNLFGGDHIKQVKPPSNIKKNIPIEDEYISNEIDNNKAKQHLNILAELMNKQPEQQQAIAKIKLNIFDDTTHGEILILKKVLVILIYN